MSRLTTPMSARLRFTAICSPKVMQPEASALRSSSVVTASAEARLVAGVLAAHDRLGATLSDDIVRFEFANLVQPATVWPRST